MRRRFTSTTNRDVTRLENITQISATNGLYEYSTTSDFPAETLLSQLKYLGFRNVLFKTMAINK